MSTPHLSTRDLQRNIRWVLLDFTETYNDRKSQKLRIDLLQTEREAVRSRRIAISALTATAAVILVAALPGFWPLLAGPVWAFALIVVDRRHFRPRLSTLDSLLKENRWMITRYDDMTQALRVAGFSQESTQKIVNSGVVGDRYAALVVDLKELCTSVRDSDLELPAGDSSRLLRELAAAEETGYEPNVTLAQIAEIISEVGRALPPEGKGGGGHPGFGDGHDTAPSFAPRQPAAGLVNADTMNACQGLA